MHKTLLSLALLATFGTAQAEEVKFVTNAAYPPFEFVDENNEMQASISIWPGRCVTWPNWNAASTTRPSTA